MIVSRPMKQRAWIRGALVALALLLPGRDLHAGGGDGGGEVPPPLGELRPFLLTLANDGLLQDEGEYPTGPDDLDGILAGTQAASSPEGAPRRLLLYAHGGMVHQASGLRRVPWLRGILEPRGVHPVVVVWRTSIVETLKNFARDVQGRFREENPGAEGWDWDLVDRFLEPLFRNLGGRLIWNEIQENALLASRSTQGGMRLAARHLAARRQADPDLEVHLAGHSAGSILFAPFLAYLTRPVAQGGLAQTVDSVTLWAPAIHVALFKRDYLPALRAGRIRRLTIMNLDDAHEQDDEVGGVYHKSVLYLVQNALEDQRHEPSLGLMRNWSQDPELAALVAEGLVHLVAAPNDLPEGHPDASRATRHVEFEWDPATMAGLAARLTAAPPAPGEAP